MKMQSRLMPWVMWLLPLAFFAFQFILRLFPALIKEELVLQFSIDATDFGMFAAMYYLGYAGMQIPVAYLLETWGARNVLALSIFICAVACWSLMTTTLWPVALVSRFLFGVGSVVGFLGTSKIISQWFPKIRYARMVGLTFSFGLIGALYGGKPVSLMIDAMGWQSVLKVFVGVCLALTLLVLLILKRPVHDDAFTIQDAPILQSIKAIFKNRALMIIALANFLMVGALEGFADVWGVPYLMQVYDISRSDAASVTSMVFFGMIFGGPLLAYLSERFNAHKTVVVLCGLGMASIFALMLSLNDTLPISLLSGLMFVVGLLCCYQVIIFAIGSSMVKAEFMGVTVAVLNCINMLGGVFFHSSIGKLTDFFWNGSIQKGVKLYSAQDYTQALWIIPISSVMGASLIVCLLMKFSVKEKVSVEV